MSRLILKVGNRGYYQGIDSETMVPAFSNISPQSHLVVSFENEEELNSHIKMKEFEDHFGKIEMIPVSVESHQLRKNRYISVEILARCGIIDTDAMFNLLPIVGSC